MNKRNLIATTIAGAIAALSISSAFAQTTPLPNMPKVDERQAKQTDRIEQGVASGQLNGKETARLEAGQAKVATAEANAKADGKVTAKERARLQRMQDKQSRHIAKQKHDKQTAPGTAPATAPAN